MRRTLFLLIGVGVAVGAYFAVRPPAPAPPPASPEPALVWVFEAPQPGSVLAAPTVTPGAVFLAVEQYRPLGRSGAVYALDPDTGKTRWAYDRGGKMLATASAPAVVGGRVFVGEGMHADFVCRLQCLDAATGAEGWGIDVGGHIEGGPAEADGVVFFPAGDDGLHAADAATGRPRWAFRAELHIDSTPWVGGGRVYAGSGRSRRFGSHQVVCLDARTGKPVWRTAVDLPAWGAPVAAGGRVFVGLGNGRLTESAPPPETPAGGLACLDADTGAHLWTVRAGDAVFGRPAVVGDRIVFASRDGNVYGVDRDGREHFRAAMGGPVVAAPAASGGRVYALSVPGRLACLDPATGREEWRYELGRDGAEPLAFAAPVVAGNRLYAGAEVVAAGTSIATLYCFELPHASRGER